MHIPTNKCFFLDILPAELRLNIYEHVLIASTPLQGPAARKEEEKYGLELALLRVNKRVHYEASAVFWSKNTFRITSVGEESGGEGGGLGKVGGDGLGGGRVFDPPLKWDCLSRIRHLSIDLLYDSRTGREEEGEGEGEEEENDILSSVEGDDVDHVTSGIGEEWRRSDKGAITYVQTLTTLLRTTTLHTLTLTATPPTPFHAKSCLRSFYTLDRSPDFATTLASLPLKSIPLAFVFEDYFHRSVVAPRTVEQQGILVLACRVLFCHSQARIQRLMEEFEGGKGEGKGAMLDLGPWVEAWPVKMPPLEEVVKRAVEVERSAGLHEAWISRMH
ncbi:hypothetical protein P280DRAFT_481447 [Massarina eburnea CBS 473.64]|uniref:Uncharacterized protein n=1 Tax=Massarina eburnea CBS 473.64 TaxID=1395130 RepID=A0A6A6RVD3_9PLEO|nr:hypothetical protein P280DRAFT_481447 [Massarina eburnea CBS 473.64]